MPRVLDVRCLAPFLIVAAACASGPVSQTAGGGHDAGTPSRTLPIPPDLQSKIERSVDIGRVIYFVDKASAIGTDVMNDNLTSAERAELGGYLTVRDATETGERLPSYTVLFYTADEQRLIKYRVRVPVDRVKKPSLERIVPPERPTEPLLTLIHARTAAIKAAGPFTQPVNPVVLPAYSFGDDGDILVELLAGTTKPNTVVLGKHFRVIVSSDGTRVKSVTSLSKTEVELSTRAPNGATPVALTATQLVTDYPVETHVFASMLARMPIYVGTSRGIWLVDRDSIQLLEMPK